MILFDQGKSCMGGKGGTYIYTGQESYLEEIMGAMVDNLQSINNRRQAQKTQLQEENISSGCLNTYLIGQQVITVMITTVEGETMSYL